MYLSDCGEHQRVTRNICYFFTYTEFVIVIHYSLFGTEFVIVNIFTSIANRIVFIRHSLCIDKLLACYTDYVNV